MARTKKIEEAQPAPPPAPKPATPEPPAHKGPLMVVCHRYPTVGYSSVPGPPVILRPFDEIVDALYKSGFMAEWLKKKIEDHLLEGHEFARAGGADGGPANTYRLAKDEDIRKLATRGELEEALRGSRTVNERTGENNGPKAPRKSRASYRVPAPGPKDAEQLKKLQRQGLVILNIMRAHVGDEGGIITGNELRTLLESKREEIKTGQDVMKLFGFHMSQFYKKSEPKPLVEYIENDEEDGDDESDDE